MDHPGNRGFIDSGTGIVWWRDSSFQIQKVRGILMVTDTLEDL
jgi:hypothetical protein